MHFWVHFHGLRAA